MSVNSDHAIYVGTAGWSYPRGGGKWNGVFYPNGMPDREKLSFYARYLDTVEVNSTFYRPVGPKTTRSWVDRTPDQFRFNVKLFQKFTHPKMFKEATGEVAKTDDDDVSAFKRSLEPFGDAEKLGALLAQFPPSFKRDAQNLEHLESLLRELREYPITVELRHKSWMETDETREMFTEYDVAWTMIDEPKFKTSLRDVPLTGRLGYFRFHGRNYKNWWHGDRDTRYDYLYSAKEQTHLKEDLEEVAEKAAVTFAVYNNHFGGKAIVNAVEMKKLLGGKVEAELPPALLELMEHKQKQPDKDSG
jgi:uncharacterized protein YecE (DUF72 family)